MVPPFQSEGGHHGSSCFVVLPHVARHTPSPRLGLVWGSVVGSWLVVASWVSVLLVGVGLVGVVVVGGGVVGGVGRLGWLGVVGFGVVFGVRVSSGLVLLI